MAKIRQKTIAEHVGVSQASVSLALNDPETSRVSQRTKERIFEYLRRHSGEIPAPRKRRELVFVQSHFTNPETYEFYYAGVLRAAEETAREFGRQMIHRFYAEPDELRSIVADDSVGGLIHVNYISSDLVRELQEKIPVVVVNATETKACDSVKVDHRAGTRSQVHYLRRLGHERIAFVGPRSMAQKCPDAGHSDAARFSGYCEGLFVEELPVRWEYVGILRRGRKVYPEDENCRAVLDALLALPEPPTAVVAFNDYHALALMRMARDMGLRLPEELSFVGCDNIDAGEVFSPRLTTLQQEREEMGVAAVKLLVERIERGQCDRPYEIFCGTRLIERESVTDLTRARRSLAEGAITKTGEL